MSGEMPYIIWDWNGTLLDDVQAGVNALNRMLENRGLSPITKEFYRAHFGFPVRPFYVQLGMDPEREWDRICVEFHDYLHEEPQHIRPDTIAALEYVKSRGGGQSILSALRQDLLLRDTATEGVQSFFDEIFGVDNLDGATKLSRGFDLLAKLNFPSPKNLSPTTNHQRPATNPLFFIGDTLHDAEVATALGATAILVAGGHQSADRLQAAGCRVAPTLLDAVKAVLD